jgi:hypothetical protein
VLEVTVTGANKQKISNQNSKSSKLNTATTNTVDPKNKQEGANLADVTNKIKVNRPTVTENSNEIVLERIAKKYFESFRKDQEFKNSKV